VNRLSTLAARLRRPDPADLHMVTLTGPVAQVLDQARHLAATEQVLAMAHRPTTGPVITIDVTIHLPTPRSARRAPALVAVSGAPAPPVGPVDRDPAGVAA
jgi:hypothetical protein